MTRCQQIPVSNITLFGTIFDEQNFPQFVPISSFGTLTDNEIKSFEMMMKYEQVKLNEKDLQSLKDGIKVDTSGNVFYTPMFGDHGQYIFQVERYIEYRSNKERIGI